MNHHLLPIDEIYQLLDTTPNGISPDTVEERLTQYGKNELPGKKKISIFKLILNQFKNVMIFILLFASIISFIIGEPEDAAVILFILLINAVIGFFQEYKAEKVLDALKKLTALNSTVRRQGEIIQVAAIQIVPGDIIILETGMVVPADVRLIEVHGLKIGEASLTGESSAVSKNIKEIKDAAIPLGDRLNMAYKSTVVISGRGEAVVVATGINTEIGRIAQLLQEDDSQTPLQIRLADFAKRLSIGVFFICLILFGVGILRGEDPMRMLLTSISVAVAAIPEALPAVVTIALALGAKRMVRHHALVRKLTAVESLGSVTFICSDKTGTITQNKMTVTDIWLKPGMETIVEFSDCEMLLLAMELNHDVLENESHQLQGDPTEVAMVEYVRQQQKYNPHWIAHFKRVQEVPFDSERKRMSTVFPFKDRWLVVTKGAEESVLAICIDPDLAAVSSAAESYAAEGKRVLAFAFKVITALPAVISGDDLEKDMHFVGLVAMIDPPREEATQAISDCYSAGIFPVMITGDHPLTARFIATQTGIIRNASDKVITGAELNTLSQEEFEKQIEYIRVYARVSPEQKLKIVKTLQKKGHFVAMTGDGVNDAPALNRANIGIAMGITGTDVSKEAAHMILLDDNFATIMLAVREGRRIYDNILKFIKYIMTSNTGEIWTIFLAPLIGLPLPLLPIHILWVNLITDGLPGLAFAYEPAEINILNRKPRKPEEGIFSRGLGVHIIWVGLLMGAVCVAAQAWAMNVGNEKWQTMVFTILSMSQMGHALAIRSSRRSLFQQGIFKNKVLIGAILITLLLQMAAIYLPFMQQIFSTQALSLWELAFCFVVSSIVFWAVEFEKLLKRSKITF